MDQLTKELDKSLNLNEKQVQIVEKIAGNDKDVVINENNYQNIKVKDYYVENAEEEIENKKFFSSEEFHDNMRRGLSVIEDLDNNTREVLRKGHKKFDELSKDKIHAWLRRFIDVKQIRDYITESRKSAKEEIKQDNDDLESQVDVKSILKKEPIQFQNFSSLFIYRAVKDDGTCSQISYSKNANAWVICTKNESALLKGKEELVKLTKQYNFIKAMGQVWFEHLSKLDAKKVQELQEYLSNKTLLAELCGAVAKQYVKYDKDPILYYFSIVENYNEDICIPPSEAELIFKKFNLLYKPIQKTVECSTYSEFYKLFKQISVEINNQSFIEKGEGEVLYICGRLRENPEKIIVLKMAKCKTIEYKLLKEGIQYAKRLQFVNNEVSQQIINDLKEILPTLKTFQKSKINNNYLASAIRLMKDKKDQINDNSIQNFIKQEFGDKKLQTIIN